MNALLTSLSRKVPLVEALRDAMADASDDGVLWGGDSDPECVGRHFTDRFWQMPPLAAPGARQELVDFCSREQIGLVLPTRDGELELWASLREELGERGTHVPVGEPDAIEACLDKLRFHEHCAREGIPSPPTALSLEEIDGERFVVKGRRGMGSRDLAVGVDRDSALAHAERLDDPIFQPLAEGVEHSVDLYVNLRGEVVEAAPRERIRVHDGESTVTETVEHPGLVAAAVALAEGLPLRGHLVIQAFARGPEVTLIECNPRVGGASTLGFHAGVDSLRWALREARGEVVEPRLGGYRRGLRLIRHPADRLIEP